MTRNKGIERLLSFLEFDTVLQRRYSSKNTYTLTLENSLAWPSKDEYAISTQ